MNERQIFLSALEIENVPERREHVRRECGGDLELLSRVGAILAAQDREDQHVEKPGMAQQAAERDPRTAATLQLDKKRCEDNSLNCLQPSSKPGSLGRLAHYEVTEFLGRGAFGIVLKAFDEKLQRFVAIKLLAPEMALTSPARKRFLREARASAAIRHEHVVAIHAVDDEPVPYLVMEFIPGQTLQQRLDAQGPLEVLTVVRLGKEIAEGLAAAHKQDLIHRDIKPANILLESGVNERVKITDFGLARAVDDASMTQSGQIAGTPMYMAPEQALGLQLDQRADLFSLGSVLYQMVSGRPPFRAASMLAVLKRVAEDTPRPISEVIPETPQWLCDIINKLLQKKPLDRYQSAQEVAELLADCEVQLKSENKRQPVFKIKRATSTSGRWMQFATILLLPVLLLMATEIAGVTHLWRGRIPAVEPGPKSEKNGNATAPKPAKAPFDSAQAKSYQTEWAKYLKLPVEISNPIGMQFRLIPPGEFTMGRSEATTEQMLATPELKDLEPWLQAEIRADTSEQTATIREPFYLGVHEVTYDQFRRFVAAKKYKTVAERNGGGLTWGGAGFVQDPDCTWNNSKYATGTTLPVCFLHFDDAEAFCAWLSEEDEVTYAIPTEAQWEFACRAGTTSA